MNGRLKVDKSMWNGDNCCALSVALNAVQHGFAETAKDTCGMAVRFSGGCAKTAPIDLANQVPTIQPSLNMLQ
jgi:hypothetical protein